MGERPLIEELNNNNMNGVEGQGQSSESGNTANVYSCNSGPPLEDDCSDTSLKLG